MTKADASKAVAAIINTIQGSLKKGEPVTLIGFGSFKVSKRNARSGRNPGTGEPFFVPKIMVPSFRVEKVLKEAVNSKK